MEKSQYDNFEDWWHNEGSGIRPGIYDDMETHARHVSEAAWNNCMCAVMRAFMCDRICINKEQE